MTVVSSDQRPQGDDPVEDVAIPVADDGADIEDRPRREMPGVLRNVTWRFFIYAPVLLVLIVLAPMLAWKGFSILRNEDTGEIIGGETDPEAPGFQALVTPTPTTLLADIAPDGSLAGVTLITLPSQDGGGNIVFLPVGTLLEVPLRAPPEATLVAIHAEGGMPALEQRLETMLGAGIDRGRSRCPRASGPTWSRQWPRSPCRTRWRWRRPTPPASPCPSRRVRSS